MKTLITWCAVIILTIVFTLANSADSGKIIFPENQLQAGLEQELQNGALGAGNVLGHVLPYLQKRF